LGGDWDKGALPLGPPQRLREPSQTRHNDISLSADGRWLAAVAGPREVTVLKVEKTAEKISLDGHRGVWDAAISPDGKWVVTATQHGSGIKVWDAQSGKLVRDLPAGGSARGRFSPDGKWLVTTRTEGVRFWQVGSWELQHHIGNDDSDHVAFTRDGHLMAFNHRCTLVQLVDPPAGQEIATLPAPNLLPISGLCFSPDSGQLVVSCFNYHTLQVWDLRAIRRQLAAMGLDWAVAPYQPVEATEVSLPLHVDVLPGELRPAK
jgi:WD40 repeat protein